jgi:hypothetical protein
MSCSSLLSNGLCVQAAKPGASLSPCPQ